MRNKYPDFCYRCGLWCPAGEGHFEKRGRRWRVQHADCAVEYRGTAHESSPQLDSRPQVRPIPLGTYVLPPDFITLNEMIEDLQHMDIPDGSGP